MLHVCPYFISNVLNLYHFPRWLLFWCWCEYRGCTSFHPLIALQIPVVCRLLSCLETTLFDQCFKLSSFHLKPGPPRYTWLFLIFLFTAFSFLFLIICRK
ncbi:hypothetical protein BDV32DRAFT_120547 [Aspergillus pseudonomiae]|nr:hypothetical protein BDV32DRAFT_120547 [Aspergillus pseudonomiae]